MLRLRARLRRSEKVVDLRIERVLRAIEAEPNRRYSVRELAKLAGASRASFVRLFRAATGSSPQRWLTARRLERACALLLASDATVVEVAARAGYTSEFAFSRAFKRQYGLAPRHFRESHVPVRCAA
ncbi:MAG TPA: AraC family transcriptional regulator [Polyangiaceae bacterium]|nr:AraC family transcriptional regulator [Polyangiaceae bacterium]